MRKYFKSIIIVFLLIICFGLLGCSVPNDPNNGGEENPGGEETPGGNGNTGGNIENPEPGEHECIESDWMDDGEYTCGETADQITICTICGELMNYRTIRKVHEYEEEIIKEPTCTENGLTKRTCKNCGNEQEITEYSKGHEIGKVVVVKQATATTNALREVRCANCNESMKTLEYVNNGYALNGKLSVKGPDLVNKSGAKVQLYGLSTHGVQWFGQYLNFDTIASLQETFGINVIRFAFYTDENGYCDGSEAKKQQMLEDLHEGIEAATKLGLYVIVDWHMVGAENEADKNPLTYMEESKEFFSTISKQYRRQSNIIYEIMNEPNGRTTWADCKKYANEVIPCIRANTDAIILVGNPSWTADLTSVMKDPLVGYENIMYTYHFYAATHRSTTQVETAYDKGFPVFISEFGFMDSDGDGDINKQYGENWLRVLDQRNISYVAWNISNSKGSASIFKEGSYDMVNVDDSNLKEWGQYLKQLYRKKSGLK